ncbi:MAG: hypothetical protein NVS2B16_14550 [Chloroflexota bacterium]
MHDPIPYMTNEEAAHALFKVASILELVQDNRFRVQAYRRAAIQVLMLPRPLADYVATDTEAPLRGVGERMRAHLVDLVNTGHIGVYDSLREELGEPLFSLLSVPGIGPKTAIRLVRDLGITSLEDLAQAAAQGKIQTLYGFGPKRQANLLREAEEQLRLAA